VSIGSSGVTTTGAGSLAAQLRPYATTRAAYVCSGCGYGISVAAHLPDCPMCGGDAWQPEPFGARGAGRRDRGA
jgi:rubrerythrin